MIVLGISAFYHDSAAALVIDGEVIAAAQEERFSRKKHDCGFPGNAAAYCLDAAGVSLDEVSHVGFYDKPFLTFGRLVETYLSFAPAGFPSFVKAIPVWVKEKILQKKLLVEALNELGRGNISEDRLLFGFHHHSHAASAFYPSPFEEAAVVVMDGVGEWATTSLGAGSADGVELLEEIRFPHSLGLLYSAFTYYLGFAVNDGEYKVMGLAPYGEPKFERTIHDNLIDIKEDGSYRLDLSYFNYCTDLRMTNDRFHDLFGGPPRDAKEAIRQHHMDLARSLQAVLEDAVLGLCRRAHEKTGSDNLCLAGGVALNCVANGRILREGPFRNVWIQPASGDAGGSLGVALAIDHLMGGARRKPDSADRDAMRGCYLGPAFGPARVHAELDEFGAVYADMDDAALFYLVADHLAEGRVVGWFQDRMEFGPRALGNRSIIADPRSTDMQRLLNLKIKYRESFRPFAPAVLHEDAAEYFELAGDSPYMLLVAQVQSPHLRQLSQIEAARTGLAALDVVRSDIPAITHVDCSARIQTVHADTNPRFHRLLWAFKERTGCGVLVNTSFNVRDEPIVCSPRDAYKCFMATEMDVLALGNTLLLKAEQ